MASLEVPDARDAPAVPAHRPLQWPGVHPNRLALRPREIYGWPVDGGTERVAGSSGSELQRTSDVATDAQP